MDAIYDIGRIENVHFNPWWSSHSKGLCVSDDARRGVYLWPSWLGDYLGIGADDCNRAVLVEQRARYGLLIANAEFTSFHGDDPTMIEVREANKGVVRLSNSAFWGPCNQIAKIAGTGTVGFSECTFVQWGKEGRRAAIQASSGSVLIRGCEFLENKPHILLGEEVTRAVVTGNLFSGPAQIENHSRRDVQIGLNAASA